MNIMNIMNIMKFLLVLILQCNGVIGINMNIKVRKNYVGETLFKQYIPANSNPSKIIAFYSGGNSIIPSDIYSSFLKQLASEDFSVYAMTNNKEANSLLYDTLYGKEIYILSHSSGCVTAINDANSMRDINSAIFMDPVNNQGIIANNIFIDNKFTIKYLKNIFILNAEKSYKWSIFPEFNIPFIPGFRLTNKDIKDMNSDIVITSETAEEYGHSDVLDSIWSDFMHKTISKGFSERSDEKLEVYHNWLAKSISNYINNTTKLNIDINVDLLNSNAEIEII